NYDQNISLEDVARVINLSKQYVCSIFKKETGQNLSTYINQIRIDKAKQLLLNPANSNKDIYALVGYSNQQYFSRVFKKMTGMTTTEYKEQAREHGGTDGKDLN
ncbi:MAG TPA: AraC family transcriptional regulator, partial [Fusibacter sp.]|nr:AraC family transcriptional regulator [Fusibacter sp.]